MIKNGYYCIYQGEEYEFGCDMNNNYKIRTKDIKKIDSTFENKHMIGIYIKNVTKSDLDKIYSCNTIGRIGNIKFHVDKELENSYIVGTGSTENAEKLGLPMMDKYYFVGEIPKEGVIIEIEKTEIY